VASAPSVADSDRLLHSRCSMLAVFVAAGARSHSHASLSLNGIMASADAAQVVGKVENEEVLFEVGMRSKQAIRSSHAVSDELSCAQLLKKSLRVPRLATQQHHSRSDGSDGVWSSGCPS
jgi:hypothetical protein